MSQTGSAQLTAPAAGEWLITGALDFSSVPLVWPELAQVITDNDRVSLSLGEVQRANSAGMVMLLEARDLARQTGCELVIAEIPSELVDLASMSQCEQLITGNSA
jgi:phospholipid transport system transporter-binding protein